MKRLAGGLAIALLCPSYVLAQERDRSLERIGLGLERLPLLATVVVQPENPPKPPTRLGLFTFVSPTGQGEIVRVSVPVGELVARFLKGVRAAQRRRLEATARLEVQAALNTFIEQMPAEGRPPR